MFHSQPPWTAPVQSAAEELGRADHRKDSAVAKFVIGAFLIILAIGVAYLFFTQAGVVPGDSAIDEREGVPVTVTQ